MYKSVTAQGCNAELLVIHCTEMCVLHNLHQIACVFEYEQVQVYSYKDVKAGKTREFYWIGLIFPHCRTAVDLENNQHLCDSEYIYEETPRLFSDASTSVPRVHIKHELARPNVHPKWLALAASVRVQSMLCCLATLGNRGWLGCLCLLFQVRW